MKVRKRDGSLQNFNLNKIRLTLERVSDELGEPFTGADLKLLTGMIEQRIAEMGKETINSAEIHKVVIEKLRIFGFTEIAKSYGEFGKKF